jgi:hypothetical protein
VLAPASGHPPNFISREVEGSNNGLRLSHCKQRVEGTSADLTVLYQGISDHQSDRSLRAIYRHAFTIALPAPGLSSRARRRDRVWPPPYRRDLERVSLPRVDPARRCSPTRPLQYIRPTAAVCYLQRDVFIERGALDWIPAIVHLGRPHCALSQFSVSVDSVMGFLPDGAASQPSENGPA